MANSYLNRTMSTGTSRRIFTISNWVKRSAISSNYPRICAYDQDDSNRFEHFFNNVDQLYIEHVSGGSQNIHLVTTRKFRDVNSWYHIVVAVDTTQGTASNRVKLYINGVQETDFTGTVGYPAQDADLIFGTANVFYVGASGYQGVAQHFDGYISHAAHVDGQALAPTVFGETDSTSGIWKFKSPSGVTWGTNGFHLKFENSGAMGTDSSGNTNTFTVNGNLKQALDTPSNVYCTMNPNDNYYANSTFSNGNNTIVTNSSNYTWNTGTLGMTSGKFYWEVKYAANSNSSIYNLIGIADRPTTSTTAYLGSVTSTSNYGYYSNGGQIYAKSGSGTSYGNSYGVGDIIGVAVDLDNNKLYFSKNGTWQNSSNPSTGTNGFSIDAISSTTNGYYLPASGDYGSTQYVTNQHNFGNGFFGTTAISSAGSNGNGSLFEYDVPSGYYALNTKNINTYG